MISEAAGWMRPVVSAAVAVGRVLDVEMMALDDSLFPSASYIFIRAGRNLINVGSTSRSSLVGKVARCGRHRPTMAPLCVRLRVSKHDAFAAGGAGGKKVKEEHPGGRRHPCESRRRLNCASGPAFLHLQRFTVATVLWVADTSSNHSNKSPL